MCISFGMAAFHHSFCTVLATLRMSEDKSLFGKQRIKHIEEQMRMCRDEYVKLKNEIASIDRKKKKLKRSILDKSITTTSSSTTTTTTTTSTASTSTVISAACASGNVNASTSAATAMMISVTMSNAEARS